MKKGKKSLLKGKYLRSLGQSFQEKVMDNVYGDELMYLSDEWVR